MAFILFISFVILLRIGELILSKSNEKWLLQQGAIEYGQKHYLYIIILHVLFFVSLIIEYTQKQNIDFSVPFLICYFLLLAFKVWIIVSLGKYWNTKIYRIPNAPLIKKGLYRFIKHPNYMVVIIEIALIPFIFHLYFTAILFTILNLVMLAVRINVEDKALKN